MNLNEMLNPWAALRRAKLEVDILSREQTLLADELRRAERDRLIAELTPLQAHNRKLLADLAKARKNDNRGKDGKFKKGDSK